MQVAIVSRVHLVCYLSPAGALKYQDTGIRCSDAKQIQLAYRLVDSKMLGTLTRKHYGFAIPEIDLIGPSRGRECVMRLVPAYRSVYVEVKNRSARNYYLPKSAYSAADGMERLLIDLRSAKLAFHEEIPCGLTEESLIKEIINGDTRSESDLAAVYAAAAHDDSPDKFAGTLLKWLSKR